MVSDSEMGLNFFSDRLAKVILKGFICWFFPKISYIYYTVFLPFLYWMSYVGRLEFFIQLVFIMDPKHRPSRCLPRHAPQHKIPIDPPRRLLTTTDKLAVFVVGRFDWITFSAQSQ